MPPLERAALLVPDSALFLRNLGAAYHAMDRVEDATRAFQDVLLQDQAGRPVYNNLGTVFFYRGLYDQAMRAFESATRFAAMTSAWNSLADTYRLIPDARPMPPRPTPARWNRWIEGLAKTPDNLELRTRRLLMLAEAWRLRRSRERAAAAELTKASPTEEFRVAAAWEVCKDRDRALEVLMRAIQRGYPLEQVRRDPDLSAAARRPALPQVPRWPRHHRPFTHGGNRSRKRRMTWRRLPGTRH